MKPWWETHDGRLAREEEARRADGIEVERDAEAFVRGVVRLRLRLPEGRWMTTELVAVYPDTFPYTRPEIFAPALDLPHHQNPHMKNLCLMPRSSEYWLPTWTTARLLREQLPRLSEALRATDKTELKALEIEQGEPLTYYFSYEEDSAVVIDSGATVPQEPLGLFAAVPLQDGFQPLRARVAMIGGRDGRTVWTGRMSAKENESAFPAMWVRVAHRPAHFDDAAALLAALEMEHPELARAPWKNGIQLFAILFDDELAHRSQGVGWLFAVRRRGSGKGGKAKAQAAFIRAERAGVDDLAARLPEFRELQHCGIAVFGLGCMGAPSVLDFARSGMGTLNLLDSDVVEAGTTVRWPFGISAAGRHKAKVLYETITRDYPSVRSVRAHLTRLGLPEQKPHSEGEAMEMMLTGIELVYDATGEPGLQYLLSTAARERQLPYVCVSGTHGAWGGLVGRFNHREGSGCWWCFQAALDQTIPSPRADPAGGIQPAGCSSLTYTGANFDMMEVALQGVRLATATLLARRGAPGDYGWDVAVVNLRDANGRRIEPHWTVYTIERNPACPVCHR